MSTLLETRDYYKPFQYPWAFEAYEMQNKLHWVPDEVPLSEDIIDWNKKLTAQEKALLTQLFRFFTQADVDVAKGYCEKYLPIFKHPEIRMMLLSFASMESTHIHAYSLLLDTVGMPEVEYKAFHEFTEMQEKHDYMFEHNHKFDDPVKNLILDVAVFSAFGEGMQLFSSFAILMNFQRNSLMKGMSTIVEWSIRDESLHVHNMIELFHTLIKEYPHVWTDEFKYHIYEICREMVSLEDKFIELAFQQGGIKGMEADDVKQYIRYIADRRLLQLGLKPNYGVKDNPFEWLDWIMNAPTHTNFFEGRSTEYAKPTSLEWTDDVFNNKGEEECLHSLQDSAHVSQLTLPHISGSRGSGTLQSDFSEKKKTNPFIVYTKEGCPWCSMALHTLETLNLPHVVIDMTNDNDRKELYRHLGVSSVPQILSPYGEHIGGYDNLKEFLE